MDDLPYTTINEDSLLFDNINLQIGKSSDSLFHVRVISAIHGKDLRSAKADIAQFSYEIVQKDTLLFTSGILFSTGGAGIPKPEHHRRNIGAGGQND
jgi:hypothetical protein